MFFRSDRAGWVSARNIVQTRLLRPLRVSVDELEAVVHWSNSQKKRFHVHYDGGTLLIKAQQGHSRNVAEHLDMEKVLEEIRPNHPQWKHRVYHGTSRGAWNSIVSRGMDTGFSKGATKREHHHFVKEIDGDLAREQEGVRFGSEVVIEVDLLQLWDAGAKVFLSESGVILTSGLQNTIPPQFIVRVLERKIGADGTRNVLYPPAELPEALLKQLHGEQEEALEHTIGEIVGHEIGRAHV